jgi:hypothetical protein
MKDWGSDVFPAVYTEQDRREYRRARQMEAFRAIGRDVGLALVLLASLWLAGLVGG